jgi:hypothetical protein
MLLAPSVPFYTATWEEWHTGAMVLPKINGPSEGLLIVAALNLVTWWQGPAWWGWPLPGAHLVLGPLGLLSESQVATCADAMVLVGGTAMGLTALHQVCPGPSA